jgi:hypothetical protein
METELAYLAGAIDSDGTIGVKRNTYAVRITRDSGSPTFSERVALRQVSPIIPAMLKTRFGGSLYVTKPSAKRGKPLYSWAATDLRAIECIKALLPFLRIKREQAINCLTLRSLKEKSKIVRVAYGRGHAGSAPRPSDLTSAMEAIYAQAKHLNITGVP